METSKTITINENRNFDNCAKSTESYEVAVKIQIRNGVTNISENQDEGNPKDKNKYNIPEKMHAVFKISENERILVTSLGDVYSCWKGPDYPFNRNNKTFHFNYAQSKFLTNIFKGLGDNFEGQEITVNMVVNKEKASNISQMDRNLPNVASEEETNDSHLFDPSVFLTQINNGGEDDESEREGTDAENFTKELFTHDTKKKTHFEGDHSKKKRSYTCNICSKGFNARRNYYVHFRRHANIKPFKCKECSDSFYNYSMFERHRNTNHLNTKFICPICQNNYRSLQTLTIHIRRHAGDARYQCPHCDMAFVTPSERVSHISHMHDSFKSFLCDICGMEFVANKDLKGHIQKCHSDKAQPCNKCNIQGCNCPKTRRKFHAEKFKRNKEQNVYVCELCDKSFKFPSILKQHIKNSHEPKPLDPFFRCNHNCDKIFPTKDARRQHVIAEHGNNRKHSCEFCGQRYFTLSHLTTHRLIHTKEKNYGCPICSKTFALNGNLKAHMLIHSDYKVFCCEKCGTNIPVHSKSQLNKNLVCSNCDKELKLVRSRKLFYDVVSQLNWEN